jgi:N6-L-threonylcarbamoyladenine synthase
MRILAIETSCDETAAAVIEDGRHVLSNVVATQIELHRRYGGVFPEVASRQHVLAIAPVIAQALAEAGVGHPAELDAVAVTHGPGLAGSLLVGVNAAKGLALGSGLPLLPINHLEGHVYSNWLAPRAETVAPQPGGPGAPPASLANEEFPVLVLIVSGGHTELVLMTEHGRYVRLGGTLDDAAGEAFDKVARLLDLGFPGGPAIEQAALGDGAPGGARGAGDPTRYTLPRGLRHAADHRYDFSFSGLKTAVLHLTQELAAEGVDLKGPQVLSDLAASFQAAVVDVLVEKTAAAAVAHGVQRVCICGGVSANRALRTAAEARFAALRIPFSIPAFAFCTDNAAMIGAAAFYRWRAEPRLGRDLRVDVHATLPLPGTE